MAQSPALLKLRQAEPALEAARRRARELEMKLEDLKGDVAMLRQRKESFLREVRSSREKMRGLRKRHTALTEKGRALEKRLLRSAMVPGKGFRAGSKLKEGLGRSHGGAEERQGGGLSLERWGVGFSCHWLGDEILSLVRPID